MAIQTIKATIQMRYGLEADLKPDQLVTGEWAVSTDTKKIWMCFRPGLVLRMATYEAFEQDMREIQLILATCQNIQAAVERFMQLAEQHASQAETWSATSESWAVGGTGTREGEDTDNSKYYSEQSKNEADRAKNEADRAAAIAGIDIDSELSETSANPVQNKVITAEIRKKIAKDGDASNATVQFEQMEERVNILSGEKLCDFFGKIRKWLTDLKPVAFSNNYTDLDNKPVIPSLTNNLLATEAGTALDAIQGAELLNRIDVLNRNLSTKQDANTAITTSNIGSQNVNYANRAGSVPWEGISGRPSLSSVITTVNTQTKEFTIEASKILSVNLPYTVPSGYIALGVIAVNANTASSAITRFMINGNNVLIELRNMTSGQQKITISAVVLCKISTQ